MVRLYSAWLIHSQSIGVSPRCYVQGGNSLSVSKQVYFTTMKQCANYAK